MGTKLKVLVACEFSGTVREAFTRLGHNAWSCDLLPTDIPSKKHIVGDVLTVLDRGWDLMIAHPPCTYLCVSGARWWATRQKEQTAALSFVYALVNSDIASIALENPIGILSNRLGKPTQIIQPWQFGHPESKSTCLWLIGLPKLVPTKVLEKQGDRWENQTPTGQNNLGPSADRWKLRSKTYQGIADAMAQQWGGTVNEKR